MIPHKLHIEISGAVGSGRSLLARRILKDLEDPPFENCYPVLYTEGQYFLSNGSIATPDYILNDACNDPILLITINHTNSDPTHNTH